MPSSETAPSSWVSSDLLSWSRSNDASHEVISFLELTAIDANSLLALREDDLLHAEELDLTSDSIHQVSSTKVAFLNTLQSCFPLVADHL
jgi:hypothetical protein